MKSKNNTKCNQIYFAYINQSTLLANLMMEIKSETRCLLSKMNWFSFSSFSLVILINGIDPTREQRLYFFFFFFSSQLDFVNTNYMHRIWSALCSLPSFFIIIGFFFLIQYLPIRVFIRLGQERMQMIIKHRPFKTVFSFRFCARVYSTIESG